LTVPQIALDDAQPAVETRAGVLVRIARASKFGAEGGAKHPAPAPGVVQFRGHVETYHAWALAEHEFAVNFRALLSAESTGGPVSGAVLE
jgi:hypothetical protein